MNRLDLDPDEIAALAHDLLRQAIGGWSMGVQGAVAEFTVAANDPAAITVHRAGRTVEALTTGGALRLAITDEACAFIAVDGSPHRTPATDVSTGGDTGPDVIGVYFAVPRQSLPPPAPGVTVHDSDPGALRPEDRRDLIVDLAVGHAAAAFCVRTGDTELGKQLRSVEGAAWADALATVGAALAGASPHRIVTTALGRIEVHAPIPADDGISPEGPHTHLLPALLRTGRELPPRLELPAGLAPAAAFHPPPGWKRPAGLSIP